MSAECSRRDGGCYPDMNEALHACDKLLARGMGAGIIGLLVHAGARARSSVGQSGGLIILWSQVRALPGPLKAMGNGGMVDGQWAMACPPEL